MHQVLRERHRVVVTPPQYTGRESDVDSEIVPVVDSVSVLVKENVWELVKVVLWDPVRVP